jgi:alpha-L-fucosidase 2
MNRREFIAGASVSTLAARLLMASSNARGADLAADPNTQEVPLSLRFDRPAAGWDEAVPLGNGRVGAMVFGGVVSERVALNETTLWGGKPHDYANPDAKKNLDLLRRRIFADDMPDNDPLPNTLLGIPPTLFPYQPFCDLHLDFYTSSVIDRYKRWLDLRTGISGVAYETPVVRFERESFVSFPDQVLVLRFTANLPGQQTFKVSLSTPHDHAEVTASQNMLMLSGQLFPHTPPPGISTATWEGPGLKFAGRAHLLNKGGKVSISGNSLMVDNADEVTILVDLATSFVNYRDFSGDPLASLEERHAKREALSYEELRSRHIADYAGLFSRVELQLDGPSTSKLTTEQELAGYKTAPNPATMALFYQMGRYLTIASSRPGGQPSNGLGIWNEAMWPPWGSKWTTNINLEMNYWPTQTGALPECAQPFYDLLADLRVTGAEVAKVHYGCKGFVVHHNTDLWRAAAPVDGSWGLWPMGGVWMSLETWEHYAFSLDKEFLRTTAYPALKDSVEFILSFLVEIPAGKPFAGRLATNPTSSPENAFILPDGVKARLTYATSMDIEMMGELFKKFASSARELGVDSSLVEAAEAAAKRLPPLQVNKDGELQEWIGDYKKTEAEHRHLSHLYALYPGDSITVETTPALAAGAKRSLELRGDADGNLCWNQAWRAALWARLRDGDRAHRILGNLLTHATTPDMLHDSWSQIDGHLGGPAAIAEMLIQSHRNEIEVLPALPVAWANGSVRGLRARGAAVLDFLWRDGALSSVTVHAGRSGRIKLRYKQIAIELQTAQGGSYTLDGKLHSS